MSFIKRHKFLSIVFVVCIFLMIKNSSIPYLFTPPSFVSLLFDKPRTEFFLGVAQIVDIFASAYVTSLLFYYMVDFLPTVKKEEKAKEIVNTKLVSIVAVIFFVLDGGINPIAVKVLCKVDKVFEISGILAQRNCRRKLRFILVALHFKQLSKIIQFVYRRRFSPFSGSTAF